MSARITTLENGLRVVTESMPLIETASVGVWVDVGARYESAALNGISHLLEHMAFKGTTRRSARAIAEEIESVGGHLNAYTSREHTAYFARVLADDVPLAIDILADILQNSTFEPDELERERGVILQEIGEAFDTPDDLVFDILQESAFPNQPLGRPILGSPENVRSFSKATLSSFMSDHYGGANMVLAAAGKVDHEEIVARAGDLLGLSAPKGSGQRPGAQYSGGEARLDRELEQVHMLIGLPGLAYEDPDFYALQVYSTILGGGMSSRLFQEVREERGLAYSIYSFSSSYVDGGLFGVYAGTSPEYTEELIEVAAGQMSALTSNVLDDEVERARAQLKASTLMALENSANRCEQFGRQLLIFDRIIPISEIIEKVDAVDGQAVKRVAERMMNTATPTLAEVGPSSQSSDFQKLLACFG